VEERGRGEISKVERVASWEMVGKKERQERLRRLIYGLNARNNLKTGLVASQGGMAAGGGRNPDWYFYGRIPCGLRPCGRNSDSSCVLDCHPTV
jgi:hypothetical protein